MKVVRIGFRWHRSISAPPLSLAAIRQPAFLYGPDGRIAEANDLAEALVGRSLAGRTTVAVIAILRVRRPDEPLRIHVGTRRTDGFWEFAVRDNGIGINPEYYDRIFVILQWLHTKDRYPGTGIGLAIVKRIIERRSGKIRVESMPGEGSTFYFTLSAA